MLNRIYLHMQAHANVTFGVGDDGGSVETNALCRVTFYSSGKYRRVRQCIKRIIAQILKQGAEYVPSWTLSVTDFVEHNPS